LTRGSQNTIPSSHNAGDIVLTFWEVVININKLNPKFTREYLNGCYHFR
jgi:hypothetical protein